MYLFLQVLDQEIGDYWDDDTVGKITDLLHEFQDLFPIKFSYMKGIVKDLK